jgi:hypothetical protein
MYTLQVAEFISRGVPVDRSCHPSFITVQACICHELQTAFLPQFNLSPQKSRSADLQLLSGSSLHSENVLKHLTVLL